MRGKKRSAYVFLGVWTMLSALVCIRAGTVEHFSFVLRGDSYGAHNKDKALLLLGR